MAEVGRLTVAVALDVKTMRAQVARLIGALQNLDAVLAEIDTDEIAGVSDGDPGFDPDDAEPA